MTFGKFLMYVVLIGASLLGLVASVCGALFASSSHGADRQLAIFALVSGIAIIVGASFGFRALRRSGQAPSSPPSQTPPDQP